jgi:hypothetical protein
MEREAACLTIVTADKEVRDGNQDDSAESGSRQRVKKSASKNSEFDEDPSAEVGADQAKHYVSDAAKAAAARDFSRQPSGDQAKEQPRNKTVRLEPDSDCLLRKQICREHETSQVKQ